MNQIEEQKLYINNITKNYTQENLLQELDKDKVQYYLDNEFYNNNFYTVMRDYINLIIDNSDNVYFINEFFTNSKLIATGSMNKATSYDFKGIKDLLIIKNSIEGTDNLIHECFIGLILNNLKQKIPNFSYVYGTFKNVNNVIYENVHSSIPLRDYLKVCDLNDLLNIVLQVLYSIDIANKEYEFVHYDLNIDNILIKNVNKEYYIQYENIFIKTNKIAMIIDYGLSRIKYNNKVYGFQNFNNNSTYDALFIIEEILNMLNIYNRIELYNNFKNIIKYIIEIKNFNPKGKDIINYILNNYKLSFVFTNLPKISKSSKDVDIFKEFTELNLFIVYNMIKFYNIKDDHEIIDFMKSQNNLLIEEYNKFSMDTYDITNTKQISENYIKSYNNKDKCLILLDKTKIILEILNYFNLETNDIKIVYEGLNTINLYINAYIEYYNNLKNSTLN